MPGPNNTTVAPTYNPRIDDLTAYPILTEDIGASTGGTPGGGSTAGASAPIGQIVQNALRSVLAWKPRAGDSKAFVSALTQSFDLKTIEGHVEWKWNQRSYAIDADLGKVTGAQASIYARAKSFLDLVMPLIQGFTPLNPAFIQDDIDAIRAVALNGVNELVNELGQEGGPRVSRVDQLFRLLLGPNGGAISGNATQPLGLDTHKLGGQLGLLRSKFGFHREFVNTISDEEMLTNFLILVDGVQGLLFTWTTQKKSFERRGNDVFLGTQAVLLSRSLGVIVEAVQDAYLVMDSVFLGAAERQVTELHLGPDKDGGDSSIFLADLLSWIEDFATTEGPLLINDGGLLGVKGTFVPTVEELERLTRRAANVSRSDSANPTPNYHHRRVAVHLENLAQQIGECLSLSKALRPNRPRITVVSPPSYPDMTNPAVLTIKGVNLEKHSSVRLERSTYPFDVIGPVIPPPGALMVHPDHQATLTPVTFDLMNDGAGYGPSTWDVVVTDPQGIDEVRPRFFEITPKAPPEPPIVTASASPSSVSGTTTTLTATATDPNGGGITKYAWQVDAPMGVQFPTSTNAPSIVVTFLKAGTYNFTATATNAAGQSAASAPVQVNVISTVSYISVTTPAAASNLAGGDVVDCIAQGKDQFGTVMNPPITWSVDSGVGSMSSAGVYTAVGSFTGISAVTVSAASGLVSGSVQFTVTAAAPIVTASASPAHVTATSTMLNATATDPNGGGITTYLWQQVGGPKGGAQFRGSPQGTPMIDVTFLEGGTFNFSVTVTNAAGVSTTSAPVQVSVTATVNEIDLSHGPQSTVPHLGTLDFRATALDQFNHPMPHAKVEWSLDSGRGTITSTGQYKAPKSGTGPAKIRATSGSVFRSATIRYGT